MDKKVILHGHSPGPPRVDTFGNQSKRRIFLLSPANLKGVRAQRLYQPGSASELSMRHWARYSPLQVLCIFEESSLMRAPSVLLSPVSKPVTSSPPLEDCCFPTLSLTWRCLRN